MRKFCGVVAVLIAALLPATVSAQSATVTGRVVDQSTQRPLAEAQVNIAGTNRGTTTNAQGVFTITNVPTGSVEVRASRYGYQQGTQRITAAAGQTATVTFALSQAVVELGGLIVTATGQEQRVREVGNAVTKIELQEVELAPVQNFSQLLQGRAPGVTIIQNSGTVGAASRIRIRGASSVSLSGTPLMIVDGVRVNNDTEATGLFTGGQSVSRIDDLNPEDIESVEILKGPAASALYGTAAANGVIQITTKRGQRGSARIRGFAQRTSLETLRSQVPTNYLARGRNAAGARVNCDVLSRASGSCVGMPDSVYEYSPLFEQRDSPLRDGQLDKYGASISGGSGDGDITYYVSAEAEEGQGVTIQNEIDRANFRANFSSQVNEKLKLNASTGFVTSFISLPQNDNSGSGIFLTALRGSPDPTNIERFGGWQAPYRPTTVSAWDNHEDLRRFTGSVNADWRPLSWLGVNATAGLDQSNRFEKSFVDQGGLASGFLATGLREQYRVQEREGTASLNANMVHELGRAITSTTTGGVQYNESVFDWTYAAGLNVTPGTKIAAEPSSADESQGGDKLFGVYASQQFGLADRLFVTAAIRGDQNSAFGENIGFITYPAISASWVVAEEPWFPALTFLSNLRLRAAYGESGLRPTRLAAARTFVDRAAAFEGGITPGYVTSNIGNADLRAEISRETEFGGELGLFDDRLGVELTRYDKKTDDALVRRPLPPSLGGPLNQFFNLGSVRNQGWEGSVRAEPIRSERFDLNLRFNFSTNKNRLVTLGDSTIPPIVFGQQRHYEGYPLGGYWQPKYTFEDKNSDGLIQRAEVTRALRVCRDTSPQPCVQQEDTVYNTSYIGAAIPTREMSFNADVTLFRAFRLSGLLDHKGGHKLSNFGRRIRCAEAALSFCEERHVPGAASLEQQAAMQARQLGFGVGGYIEDADFWKLRELSLTWTVPQMLIRRLRATDGLSLTVSGRNLKTWTEYSGPDPEVGFSINDNNSDPGKHYIADLLTLPAPRSVVIRVDASF